jgi:hypothetical protein
MSVRGKSYTERALAAYFRQIARQHQITITLAALPSHVCAETLDERDYVMVRHGARTLAVYRVKPGGFLSRLKRWPKALEQRP